MSTTWHLPHLYFSGFNFYLKCAPWQVKQFGKYNLQCIRFCSYFFPVVFQLLITWESRNVVADASSKQAVYNSNKGFRRGTEIYVKTEEVLHYKFHSAYANHHHAVLPVHALLEQTLKSSAVWIPLKSTWISPLTSWDSGFYLLWNHRNI